MKLCQEKIGVSGDWYPVVPWALCDKQGQPQVGERGEKHWMSPTRGIKA